ncbi:hypothetical protein FGM00_17835 [Aggregatimonas sangjinii]|uniref:DUF4175 family protein n=1 Tax=Aggregatimonas sangjinii TaxID=2583587 RepID=A0A5B7SYL6_9FLAO|nr:DUF4175 family protein [Aggregatimonas sangjinii]QCX01884.1 hypothetical protein FGM00_17835 [Aggregatimonas sangjinii]
MNSYHHILDKLNKFTKKYYSKILVKGVLLFLALGLLFFFVIMGVEYFLWLNSTGRLVLLMVFIAVELFLLYKYIAVPLFYLFRVREGITNKQASVLIGKHFPEVGDKLYNLLDLADDANQSELLLASIAQRSTHLNPIPFTKAVDFRENLKYAKYLALPFLIFGLIWLSGNLGNFFGSANRVVNYDMAYQPPAPFNFKLLTNELNVLDTEPVTLQLTTEGEIRPDAVFIVIDGKESLLQQRSGIFQYAFSPPMETTDFHFSANGIRSMDYRLNVLSTPSIQEFEVKLDYPNYTNRSSEVLKGTGNATIPEGTKVTWEIRGRHTERIQIVTKDTAMVFDKKEALFTFSKGIYYDFPYELKTSNQNVSDHESLAYRFNVIRDAHPTIKAKQVLDSLNPNVSYYVGEASDDYKLNSIQLICYPDEDEDAKQAIDLGSPKTNFNQFYYTFPSGLVLEEGKNYSFYFQATDNDAIHRGKTAKSQVFSMALLDQNQLKNKELESQQKLINNMDKSLEKFKEQKETLREINIEQKEKQQLNFNDQNQIRDFLQKQEQQENMMQKFSKELKENLQKSEKDDKLNQLLQERLERQEKVAEKNAKLLEELNKIADKINKEELSKRLEELGKKQQNSERSLEQLLELTKRYYVTEKAAQLVRDLEILAKKQELLAKLKVGQDFSTEEQEKLNEDFNKITEEMEELRKDNESLKKPMDLNLDKDKEEGVQQDQNEALDQINKHEGLEESSSSGEKEKTAKTASQKQKSAAQKMKEMSQQLSESSAGGASGGSSVAEDAEMLRQILENLVTFSFKQESLYDVLSEAERDMPQFSRIVREQQELRGLFEHVDDSLFALSLRQAELSEFVNEQITEVYYNIDKSLESLAESQIYQGVSYQKYVLTASNSLADFLANLLDNMNQGMQMGQGEGQSGEGFQLPDIIKKQGDLKEKMDGMGQSGQGKPQSGGEGKGKSGEGQQEGEQGSDGKQGNEGQGKKGENGTDGQGEGNKGERGQGKNGEGKTGGDGEGQGGSGNGQEEPSEAELREIYEIYKEQQQLRQQLEEQLENMINNDDRKLGEKLVRQMEDFENDLLENGVTQRGLSKINTINYELLKLKNAAMKQGKKPERESNTNRNQFRNPITTKPAVLQKYRDEIELLNRQALPLRQNHQNKVKEYFKTND